MVAICVLDQNTMRVCMCCMDFHWMNAERTNGKYAPTMCHGLWTLVNLFVLYCFRYLLHNDNHWTGSWIRCRWPVIIDLHGFSYRRSIIVSRVIVYFCFYRISGQSSSPFQWYEWVYLISVTRRLPKSKNSLAIDCIGQQYQPNVNFASAARISHKRRKMKKTFIKVNYPSCRRMSKLPFIGFTFSRYRCHLFTFSPCTTSALYVGTPIRRPPNE